MLCLIFVVRVIQMLQNIHIEKHSKHKIEKVSTQRHNNLFLIKKVLVDFSLVVLVFIIKG